jgi:mRNA-degrading endonuclease toxin of MazEF toxin-antitoxin module
MVIQQGEIWWADRDAPVGSTAGFRRPVLIVSIDKSVLTELVGRLPHKHMAAVPAGIDVVLGR